MNSAYGAFLITMFGLLPLLGASSQTVADTIASARQAAHEDKNAEAAQLFAQVVAAEPGLRLELLPELSDQLTYSGKSAAAIPLYREVLASHTLVPDAERHNELGLALALSWNHRLAQSLSTYDTLLRRNPRDIDALLGRARVLSWQDRLTPSLREYERVLTIDPSNVEASRNIARVQNWRGRQRTAKRLASALLAKHAGDADASLTLAQSDLWMGRPDRAARQNGLLLREHPNDSAALGFATDVADASRPQFRSSVSVGTQSDGLLIRSGDFGFEERAAQGLMSLGVRYQPISYLGSNANGDATERRLGIFARRRLADWSEINATVSNDEISATGTGTKNLLLYDTYLTLLPNDTLRFDVGSRKETFDNLTSLGRGITADFETLSMDVTPDENMRLSLRANLGSFSDGNRRSWEQVEFERAVVRAPRLSFGARGTSFTFSRALNDGYFDPPRYQAAELTTHLFGNARSRLYYDASASYGREWVLDGGTRPTHSLHATTSYVISRPMSVSAFYDSFDTRQQSNSGFERTVIGLRFQTLW